MATSRDAKSNSQRVLRSAAPVAQSHALSRASLPAGPVGSIGDPGVRFSFLPNTARLPACWLRLWSDRLAPGSDGQAQPISGYSPIFPAGVRCFADCYLHISSLCELRSLGTA